MFFFLFDNNIDSYYKKLLALTLFLSTIMPKIFLIILDLFINLVDRRLLLFTKCISKKSVNRLIFSGFFIRFFY